MTLNSDKNIQGNFYGESFSSDKANCGIQIARVLSM